MLPRSPLIRLFLFALLPLLLRCPIYAEEPSFFKQNDVVAFVGGENMVAAAEYGHLEMLITSSHPEYKLRFRCLAWEGDTVFEQRRDLNYPTLEQQLDKIGATVVIAQFGEMESFAGKDKIGAFIDAYKTLLSRLDAGGNRRVLVLTPRNSGESAPLVRATNPPDWRAPNEQLNAYVTAILDTIRSAPLPAEKPKSWTIVDTSKFGADDAELQRDGVHLNEMGHSVLASFVATRVPGLAFDNRINRPSEKYKELLRLIQAKNRLWHYYYRPQNWAFLAGDRTNQPSSRDHQDPSKRWFPEELEKFLPLIEQKEADIHKIASAIWKL